MTSTYAGARAASRPAWRACSTTAAQDEPCRSPLSTGVGWRPEGVEGGESGPPEAVAIGRPIG